jgi:hypothetical protein
MSILLTALGIILVFALILIMAATVCARELRRNEEAEADRYRHYKECLWARDKAQQKADKYKDYKKAA